MESPRPRRSLAARILVAQGVVLALLVVLELGVRLRGAWVHDRPLARESVVISPFFLSQDWPPPRFEADGRARFRNRAEPVSLAKPAGVFRVIAVGGSTTANKRAVEEAGSDYPGTLERLLSSSRPDRRHEVLNAGGDSFSTAHTLVNLQFRLLELDPDVVLLMHNVNDLTANYFGAGVTSDYANKYLLPAYVAPELDVGRSLPGFLHLSHALAKTRWLKQHRKGQGEIVPDVSQGLEYFRRNLRRIAALCRAEGVELVVLSQPSRMSPDAGYDLEQFTAYNRAAEEVSRETGFTFVDMFALIGHDPELFLDDFHYTPLGIQTFAERLHAALDWD